MFWQVWTHQQIYEPTLSSWSRSDNIAKQVLQQNFDENKKIQFIKNI